MSPVRRSPRPGAVWCHGLRHLAISVLVFAVLAHGNLMAVDLGTAYIKTAVARPGKGLELVPNEQSKRKTPAVVGFTEEGERLFGDAAVTYAAKKPDRVIFNARNLIGKCADGESKPAPFCKPATVSIEGIGEFTGVHLVAMLLTMARKHAEAALGNNISVKDVAVTVPSSFHSGQRAAICDAAAVADMKCLGVINSNTAAAIKYALDGKARIAPKDGDAKKSRGKRAKDANTHTALFYDVGASGVSAAVARFVNEGSNGQVSKLEVLAHASDDALGGTHLDSLLVSQLADAFDKQREGTPLIAEDPRRARELPRVMARLRKEAQRAREILSANTERMVSVGSLHQDMDLRATLTRQELEEGAASMLSNAARPAMSALQLAGVRSEDLHAVVPFGGTVRMPKIQSIVLDALKRPTMNKSINGDEAAVMGAVFFGASLSSTFRVRKLDIVDRFERTVSAEVGRDPSSGGLLTSGKQRSPQNVVIFDEKSLKMPSKKTISFNRNNDFEVKLFFDLDKAGNSPFPQRTLYSHLKVTGVAKVLDRLGKNPGSKKAKSTPTPRVALTFHLDASGNIRVGTAESSVDEVIVVEREVPIKTEKKKEKATASPSADAKEETDDLKKDEKKEANEADSKDEAKKEEKTDEQEKKKEKAKEEKKTKIEKREQSIVHRQTLKIEYLKAEESIRAAQMTAEEIVSAKGVLKKLEEADKARLERADALNALEGFILTARSKVREADEGDDLFEVTTEEERTNVISALNDAEDWMFSDEASTTEALRKKHHEVRKAVRLIEERAEERSERPKAIEQFRKDIEMTLEKVGVIEKLHVERKSGNEQAFASFREKTTDAEAWLNELIDAQDKLPSTEEPVLKVKMMDAKLEEVLKEFMKLSKLELPPAPAEKTAKDEGVSEKTNGTEGESTTNGGSDEPSVEGDGSKVDGSANLESSVKDEL